MVVPPKHPKIFIFVGKPHVTGYHHFRKPPYIGRWNNPLMPITIDPITSVTRKSSCDRFAFASWKGRVWRRKLDGWMGDLLPRGAWEVATPEVGHEMACHSRKKMKQAANGSFLGELLRELPWKKECMKFGLVSYFMTPVALRCLFWVCTVMKAPFWKVFFYFDGVFWYDLFLLLNPFEAQFGWGNRFDPNAPPWQKLARRHGLPRPKKDRGSDVSFPFFGVSFVG